MSHTLDLMMMVVLFVLLLFTATTLSANVTSSSTAPTLTILDETINIHDADEISEMATLRSSATETISPDEIHSTALNVVSFGKDSEQVTRTKGKNPVELRKVRIACLVPFDQFRLFPVHEVHPAFDLALNKVASLGLLPDLEIEVRYRDSKCSISDAMNEAVNFYANHTADVYFGPVCDYAAAPVARQVRYWNKAMITVGAMAFDFVFKLKMFPTLTRVGPNFNSLHSCLQSLLAIFGWKRVKLMYEPDGFLSVMDRYCHIAIDGIHRGLRLAYEEGQSDIIHDYSKFYKIGTAVEDLPVEVGNQYADQVQQGVLGKGKGIRVNGARRREDRTFDFPVYFSPGIVNLSFLRL